MSTFDIPHGISLWHHGVLGQKWGVIRSPEELGHDVAKSKEDDTIREDYHSKKGFSVAWAKLAKFCLNPAKKHSNDFLSVGYTTDDADLLFKHIEEGFDIAKKVGDRKTGRNEDQFRIPMELGVTRRKTFTTTWQIDPGQSEPKFTSAYVDRRNKEND